MGKILNGKDVADSITNKLKSQVQEFKQNGITPCIAIVRVGENPSDIAYEKGVLKKAETLGIKTNQILLDENIKEDTLISKIEELNEDPNVHGVLMFRPLPGHLNEDRVRNTLNPAKDIDCITDESLHNVFVDGNRGFAPCTAKSVMAILEYYGVDLEGKKVVVVGRSLVIGKPVAMLLLRANATVTICHSKTSPKDLINYCQNADVIISAVGRQNTITSAHVNDNQIIIDVGINFDDQGKMCGDVDFEGVKDSAKGVTPVPRGVGSVTTTILMEQLLKALKNQNKKNI